MSKRGNYALATLSSRQLLARYIEQEALLPVLFEGDFDRHTGKWTTDDPPTLEDAVDLLDRKIRTVVDDEDTGLVTLSIDWRGPALAARWAAQLVTLADEEMRRRSIDEAKASMAFLEKHLQETRVVELQQAIYTLMESETNRIMLASSRPEFAFRVIDPARTPDADASVWPNGPLWERVSYPKKGSLSILSQSGAFAVALLDLASQEGVCIAKMVNYGNRLDVGESTFLPFLRDDIHTRVIAIYMESVDHGRKLIAEAMSCSRKIPIVALKVGKGAAGIAAAKSHTGAIAGNYAIYKAAFLKSGIIEANGLEEFIDGVKALSMQNPPKGNRILIVTNGGGFGVIVADHCAENGLEVPLPSPQLKEKLRNKLSAFYVVNNPVDLTGSACDRDYHTALTTAMLESDEYDAVIIIPLMAPQGMTEKVVELIADTMKRSEKPAVICTVGGAFTMKIKQLFEDREFPVYPSPERSAKAMSMLLRRRMLQEAAGHSPL